MSNFQKRHYEAIATVLKDATLPDDTHAYDRALGEETRRFIIHSLAALFVKDNPSFSIDRFFDAAGLP